MSGLREEAGRLALRDSVLMAAADGEVDDDEKEVLEEIIAYLGLKDDALDRLLKWTVEGYNWMQSGYDILNDLSGELMFPDPVNDLTIEERLAHAQLMVAVAASDGELVKEEMIVLEAIMGKSMLHQK